MNSTEDLITRVADRQVCTDSLHLGLATALAAAVEEGVWSDDDEGMKRANGHAKDHDLLTHSTPSPSPTNAFEDAEEARTVASPELSSRLVIHGSGDELLLSISNAGEVTGTIENASEAARVFVQEHRRIEKGCKPEDAEVAREKAEDLARQFHETYERLAPQFEYSTRSASAVPWDDVPEPNKSLMIAVARAIIANPENRLYPTGYKPDTSEQER